MSEVPKALFREQYAKLIHELSFAPTYYNQVPYEPTGERKLVIRKGCPFPKKLDNGSYPYVVLPNGEIRISGKPRPAAEIHHPELCKGLDVVAAGMFYWNGENVSKISNESGHYCPDLDCVIFALAAFRFWGVPMAEEVKDETWWGYLQ